jgi:predicted nucleotidyltransferase
MDALVQPILDEAERDANVVGVLLKGSQAMDAADEESDWDVVVVLLEGEPSQKKDGRLELVTTTLERVRDVSSWELPALAYSRVLLDKTGELAGAVEAAGHLTRKELEELYDNYLNDFYRSLKAWRRGRELGARILSGRSLWWLGDFLMGLEGRRAPYTEYWGGRLGELEPVIVEVARTADPGKQQELQATVERIATAHGFRDVYDAWNGDIDRVMDFRFE